MIYCIICTCAFNHLISTCVDSSATMCADTETDTSPHPSDAASNLACSMCGRAIAIVTTNAYCSPIIVCALDQCVRCKNTTQCILRDTIWDVANVLQQPICIVFHQIHRSTGAVTMLSTHDLLKSNLSIHLMLFLEHFPTGFAVAVCQIRWWSSCHDADAVN